MINIRPATMVDIAPCVELLRLLFAIESDFAFHNDKVVRGLELLLNSDKDVLLVAHQNTEPKIVVAMCSVQTLISTAEGGAVGLIEDVIVSPDYRRKGIARQLLNAAEQWAIERNLKRLQLLADKRNTSALEFYTAHDWQRTQLVALRKFI
ncbi:MAG: GNAT family N-acetyltransferase [Methylococcaceae bacterium]